MPSYDGIEFDSVAELIEYKEWESGQQNKEKPTPDLEPTPDPDPDPDPDPEPEAKIINRRPKRKVHKSDGIDLFANGKPWTKAEDKFLRDNYKDSTNRFLMAKLGRTKGAIKVRACHLKLNPIEGKGRPKGRLSSKRPENWEKETHGLMQKKGISLMKAYKELYGKVAGGREYELMREWEKKFMIRKKPVIPNDYDTIAIKKAEQDSYKVPEFPVIYPVREEDMVHLIPLIQGCIATKGKISRFDVEKVCMTIEGEWHGRLWATFCSQFALNTRKICKYFSVEDKFKIKKEKGFHYIFYGG